MSIDKKPMEIKFNKKKLIIIKPFMEFMGITQSNFFQPLQIRGRTTIVFNFQ